MYSGSTENPGLAKLGLVLLALLVISSCAACVSLSFQTVSRCAACVSLTFQIPPHAALLAPSLLQAAMPSRTQAQIFSSKRHTQKR